MFFRSSSWAAACCLGFAVPASAATVPALTPVSIEVMAPLGSNTSKSGETFPIRLAEPIVIDGVEVVPAGTTGIGEVVHAKKSGGMGTAGELVLAARYLDWNGQRLKLRSMRFSANGRSAVGTVNAINIAGAASFVPIGMVGFFINGGQVHVAQGAVAEAKTAEAFDTQPMPAAPDQTATTVSKGEE